MIFTLIVREYNLYLGQGFVVKGLVKGRSSVFARPEGRSWEHMGYKRELLIRNIM